MPSRYVLIGNGAAGLSAAEAIRQHDSTGQITIVTEEPHAFYSRPGLAYFLTNTIPQEQLFPRAPDDLRQLGVQTVHARAMHIDPHAHQVHFSDGRSVTYDALLLATGASAILPDTPGMELDGVVTLDCLEDALHILRLSKRARRAVVIGGGVTALELAEGLAARDVQTHYLLRGDRYWSQVLDEDESAMVEDSLANEGIVIHRRTNIQRVLGRRGRVAGVLTDRGQTIQCQIVAVAIGIQSRLELANSAGLETDRGVLVGPGMCTSDPDIFAAGDVAQVFDPLTRTFRLDSLWWIAQEQGYCAGCNMAGLDKPYVHSTSLNITRIGGVITAIIGAVGQTEASDGDLETIIRGDSELWREALDSFAVESEDSHSRVRLMVNHHNIVGAVVMGDQRHTDLVREYICEAIDIRPIRELLTRNPQRSVEILTAYRQRLPSNGSTNGRHVRRT